MASSTVSWGIEIGAASIKALKIELVGDDQVKVRDFAVIQHPKVLSTPGVDPSEVLRVSLGTLVANHDLSKASIAISVPGHSSFARFAKLPPVEPKKVPDIVKFEAIQQIPFQLEEVEWDYQTFQAPDSPDVEVGIFAVKRDRIMEQLDMLQELGITPNHVVLSPIAVYNALAYDLSFSTDTPGTILVDVGTTSTDLIVATPGRVWVRTFPIGGHQFTEALVNQFQLTYAKAEKLKREADNTKHARQVFQAMRPVFADLAQDVQRSVGFYEQINRDAELSRLIGVGSTFQLPGLRKYLKQQLSLDVYRIEQFKRLEMDGERNAELQANALTLVTAYGLALQGVGLQTVQGNLMPVNVIRESMWREKTKWFVGAAAVGVAAAGFMFIRPTIDHFSVVDNPKPATIQQVVSRANTLKSEAQEAGVVGAGEPDYRAANLLSLLERRGVFLRISADVKQMFARADSRAATWATDIRAAATPSGPPLSILALQTQYMPPAAAEGDPFGGGMTDPNAPPAQNKLGEDFPRIKCVLMVETNQPEPRRFIKETIESWLIENKMRDSVEFELAFEDPPFSVQAAQAAATPGGVGEVTPPTGGGRGQPDFGPGSRGPGGRGFPDFEPPRPAGGIEVGGSGPAPSAEEQAAKQSAAAALQTLTQLAPVEPPDGAGYTPTGTATVTWYVVFKPKQPAEGDPAMGGGQ